MWLRELTDWLLCVPREWLDVAVHERGMRMRKVLGGVFLDVRYGLRGLMHRPSMTVVLAATLGFGIGGVAAIDSVLRGTLFRSLPYPEPEQVRVFSDAGSWAAADLDRLEGGGPVMETVAAYHSAPVVVRAGDAQTSAENALVVSRDFFAVLESGPFMGRGFDPSDFVPGAPAPIMITHGLWLELGGDPAVVGSLLSVDGVTVPVAGVMPAGFFFPDPGTRIYRPMQLDPANEDRFLTLVARLQPGVTGEQMQAEASRLTTLLGREGEEGAEPLTFLEMRAAMFGESRGSIFLTTGALILVLVMAGINVSTLLVANTQRRLGELSIRSAIGASRGRLTAQLVTESALLGVLGAGMALVLGVAGFELLVRSLPISAGDASLLAVDPRFAWIALGLGLGIGSLAGAGVSLVIPMSARSAGQGQRTTTRVALLQNGLVVSQIALSVALVGAAGVLVRSVGELSRLETGMSPGEAVVLDVVAGAGDFPADSRSDLYREILEGIGSLAETEAVGLTQKLPLRGPGWTSSVNEAGLEAPEFVPIRFVSPGYFEALGIPLVSGRLPDAQLDAPASPPAAWANQSLAGRLWPGEDPSGRRRLTVWGAERLVAGVIGDVSEAGLTDEVGPAIYVSIAQVPRFLSFTIVARPRPGAGMGYASRIRGHLSRTQPRVAVERLDSFDGIEAAAKGDTLMIMRLLVLLGVLALVVGAVGVHGVVSQWARGRVRGWAVSMALGATPVGVLGAVVKRSAILTLTGVALGLLLFALGGSAVDSLLYGVDRFDPVSIIVTSAVMVVIGLIGAVAPAVQAGRTDPAMLLRLQ